MTPESESNGIVKVLRAFLVIYTTLVFCFIFFILIQFGFFTVKQIKITGNQRVSQEEILKRSGLVKNETVIFFLKGRVTGKIIKNPWITRADIQTEFPDKVSVKIIEAEPFCIAIGNDGIPYYMSASGQMLGRMNFSDGLDFPVLIGEGIKKPEILGDALKILKLSMESEMLLWNNISELNLDPLVGISVFTNDKTRIGFGRRDIKDKWNKVEKIISDTKKRNLAVRYIDVSLDVMGVVSFKL